MPAQTREIKGRIKAVGNIQRITKTMQMIATARFQAMQKRATSAQAYTRRIAQLVGELSSSAAAGGREHPLLSAPAEPVGRRLLLVITSNRGLCGAYNANVLRQAMRFIREQEAAEVDVEAVGKKAVNFMRFNRVELSRFHEHIGDTPRYEDVEVLASQYMADFEAGMYDGVHVAFTEFESMSRQTARVMRLLPAEDPTSEAEPDQGGVDGAGLGGGGAGGGGGAVEYDFTPGPEELLADLLPVTIKTRLFQCFNESVVSEQLSRMVAMKAATDAAGKMKKSLQQSFNRARQAAITTELSEIISGAAALE